MDCSKAAAPVEKQICADPSLVTLDQEMGKLYRNAIQNTKDAAAWKADQRAWLGERDQCTDAGCLRSAYQERLVILRTAEPHPQWDGHWWRVDATGSNGSQLAITHANAKGFAFDLSASAGANSGELEGKAILDASNAAARYKGTAQSDTEGCSLVFTRILSRLKIEQTGDDATCGAGAGVYFSGTYVASNQDPNAKPDLVSLGVLPSQSLDDALRKLLGKDYDYVVGTADMVDSQPGGKGVTVVSMAARGVACNTKSILMFDTGGHLWAAVWEPASSPPDVVELRYYTNVAGDKKTLPKTIADDRDACSGDTVRVRMMP